MLHPCSVPRALPWGLLVSTLLSSCDRWTGTPVGATGNLSRPLFQGWSWLKAASGPGGFLARSPRWPPGPTPPLDPTNRLLWFPWSGLVLAGRKLSAPCAQCRSGINRLAETMTTSVDLPRIHTRPDRRLAPAQSRNLRSLQSIQPSDWPIVAALALPSPESILPFLVSLRHFSLSGVGLSSAHRHIQGESPLQLDLASGSQQKSHHWLQIGLDPSLGFPVVMGSPRGPTGIPRTHQTRSFHLTTVYGVLSSLHTNTGCSCSSSTRDDERVTAPELSSCTSP